MMWIGRFHSYSYSYSYSYLRSCLISHALCMCSRGAQQLIQKLRQLPPVGAPVIDYIVKYGYSKYSHIPNVFEKC